jgi:ribonucleoside-diphosphate reductase alpha chain
VYVKENEWLEVGAWVYEHFDRICGVSFLPHNDHVYEQAPYQDITEDEYTKLSNTFPKLDWTKLASYEGGEDHTTGMQEYACVGNSCELI